METNDTRDRKITNLDDFIPVNPNTPYDMHSLIHTVVDDSSFLKFMENLQKIS